METISRTFAIPNCDWRTYLEGYEKVVSTLQRKGYEILPVTEEYAFRLSIRNPKEVVPTNDYNIWRDFPQEDVPPEERMGLVGKMLGRNGEIQTLNYPRLDRLLSRYNFNK